MLSCKLRLGRGFPSCHHSSQFQGQDRTDFGRSGLQGHDRPFAGNIKEKVMTGNMFLEDGPDNRDVWSICGLPLNKVDQDALSGILQRFECFSNFDLVETCTEHYFLDCCPSGSLPKEWQLRIQQEWEILKEGLPGTIYVRAYESHMNLLRAAIIGTVGTPYENGLYFFDIFFPSTFPNDPPEFYHRGHGMDVNPNLQKDGNVCLSSINTALGDEVESWDPKRSSVYLVLTSIQPFILNDRPYFNEENAVGKRGTNVGDAVGPLYNEKAYILNLKTMSFCLRRPLKPFEDFILGHFHRHAKDILDNCMRYLDGAVTSTSSPALRSERFKKALVMHANAVVEDLINIGVQGCEKFPISTSGESSSSRSD